jgi:hypothetical protein
MRIICIILVLFLLSGCGLFQNEEQESDVVITHTCTIDIAESAAVRGEGDSDDMLHIISYPDCRVEVSTEMIIGDHVMSIEEQRSRATRPMAIPVPENITKEYERIEETTVPEGEDGAGG